MEKPNKWEVWHDKEWTEFEFQSAIFGHLRKELYSKGYIVRGNYCFILQDGMRLIPDISIFKIETPNKAAVLKLIIELKKEDKILTQEDNLQIEKYKLLKVPVLLKQGRQSFPHLIEEVLELV